MNPPKKITIDPPDLPPLECTKCGGTVTTGGSDYNQGITCTCSRNKK